MVIRAGSLNLGMKPEWEDAFHLLHLMMMKMMLFCTQGADQHFLPDGSGTVPFFLKNHFIEQT